MPGCVGNTGPTWKFSWWTPHTSHACATAFSTSSLMRCSPNAERKYFVRPVKRISGGFRFSNATVSPTRYDHTPAHDVRITAY